MAQLAGLKIKAALLESVSFEKIFALMPASLANMLGIGKVLDRLNRPDEATVMYRRSREVAGR